MKRLHTSTSLIPLLLGVSLFLLTSCDLGNEGLWTEEETLEAASQIIGESLSDSHDGLLASMTDANAPFSNDGLGFGSNGPNGPGGPGHIQPPFMNRNDSSGRGMERSFERIYDPETGIHTITFERNLDRERFTRTMKGQMEVIVTDTAGNFVENPRRNRNIVDGRDYTGTRSGRAVTPRRVSEYTRTNTFVWGGLSSVSDFITVSGTHRGVGKSTMSSPRRESESITRSYELDLELTDVQLEKALIEANEDLTEGVTGTISYIMIMTKTRDGETETEEMEGTIELTGDGTALLEFKGFSRSFLIQLRNGDVEGREGRRIRPEF